MQVAQQLQLCRAQAEEPHTSNTSSSSSSSKALCILQALVVLLQMQLHPALCTVLQVGQQQQQGRQVL
jgi:hypothetical protein